MAKVIFYEKPGCGGNARQKALLARSGHMLDVRDLLSTPWTADELRAYFGKRPVSEWFNAASPRVKSGEVMTTRLDEAEALALMLADPLLIRRPLLESGGRREAGFDTALLSDWIGLETPARPVGEGCPSHADEHAVRCAVPDVVAAATGTGPD